MNRIDNFFTKKRFMAHAYYGDPDKEFSKKLIKKMIDSKIDILELGIPFSDPQVDGETFQRACIRALKNNTTPVDVLSALSELRNYNPDIPIIITTYYNVILQYGIDLFVQDIKLKCADGVIVPDITIEEAGDLIEICKKNDIKFIFIITPYTSEFRMKNILSIAEGFVYFMRSANVTGSKMNQDNTKDQIHKIKSIKEIPVMTGFGITNPETSKEVIEFGSDGVIIGSAIAKIYEKHIFEEKIVNEEKCLNEISDFIIDIKGVL